MVQTVQIGEQGNSVLGQPGSGEHVGAGSEPANLTAKKVHFPWRVFSSCVPSMKQNNCKNFEQSPTSAVTLEQPTSFYTEKSFLCYQKMV